MIPGRRGGRPAGVLGRASPTPRFVGWWCLNHAPEDAADAELGYRLRREAWSHGSATEGALALLEHGSTPSGWITMWAQTMAVNTGRTGT